MEIDKTTFADLSLFGQEAEYSIFHKLDFTRTTGGRERLLLCFNQPFGDLRRINETQQILALIIQRAGEWPLSITNGTVMVLEKFYGTAIDMIPPGANPVSAFQYKLFHGPDYSFVRYSVGHFADFIRGMFRIIDLFAGEGCPPMLADLLQRAARLLDNEILRSLAGKETAAKYTPTQVILYGGYLSTHFKSSLFSLIEIYNQLDAWYSMAMATQQYNMSFPAFRDQEEPYLEFHSLYHILLPAPVRKRKLEDCSSRTS